MCRIGSGAKSLTCYAPWIPIWLALAVLAGSKSKIIKRNHGVLGKILLRVELHNTLNCSARPRFAILTINSKSTSIQTGFSKNMSTLKTFSEARKQRTVPPPHKPQ